MRGATDKKKTEGFVSVEGGRVWYRSVGSGGIPLLLLHGGPGAGHDYLEPLETLAADRPVIFYDQLGCGRSERPDSPALWRLERFVAEVAQLRQALGLSHIHLLGHSWGGWLALEYLLGQPAGVVSVVLASTSASVPEVVTEIQKLKAQLPRELLVMMSSYEEAGDYVHPEYQAAVMEFYKGYLCRLDVWPDCLMRSVGNIDGNQVYLTMNGPNEFTTIGNLKDWERRDRLHEICVPTLITVGGHDEVPLACAQTLQHGIRGSELAVFDRSAHMAMLEETDAYVGRLADFLAGVEKAIVKVEA
jgi:proline-specific peptidase